MICYWCGKDDGDIQDYLGWGDAYHEQCFRDKVKEFKKQFKMGLKRYIKEGHHLKPSLFDRIKENERSTKAIH